MREMELPVPEPASMEMCEAYGKDLKKLAYEQGTELYYSCRQP